MRGIVLESNKDDTTKHFKLNSVQQLLSEVLVSPEDSPSSFVFQTKFKYVFIKYD